MSIGRSWCVEFSQKRQNLELSVFRRVTMTRCIRSQSRRRYHTRPLRKWHAYHLPIHTNPRCVCVCNRLGAFVFTMLSISISNGKRKKIVHWNQKSFKSSNNSIGNDENNGSDSGSSADDDGTAETTMTNCALIAIMTHKERSQSHGLYRYSAKWYDYDSAAQREKKKTKVTTK